MSFDGAAPGPTAYLREETYARTRLPVSLASTLIPDAYTSPEFFALERERVFGTSWVAVATTSELARPGDTAVVEVAGRSVIVLRDGEGELRGFQNVCRHRGARLLEPGRCSLERHIKCPYHSWAYALDGRCLGTPLFDPDSPVPLEEQQAVFDMSDVQAFDKADYGLLPVRVERWGFLVFVNLDSDAAPLADQLGDLPARLAGYRMDDWQVVRTKSYEIEANYKLVAENFAEYYHLPWVHPGLVKISPMKAHHRWQGAGMYLGMCTSPIARNTDEGGWQGLPPVAGLNDDDAVSARFATLFPNTALSVLPTHVFCMLARPVAPGHTSEETHLLVNPESLADPRAEEEVEKLAAFWDLVNQEDIEIVERVQLGLSTTDYAGGRMCYRFEEPLHRYQNMLIDRMLGIRRVPAGDADVAPQPVGLRVAG